MAHSNSGKNGKILDPGYVFGRIFLLIVAYETIKGVENESMPFFFFEEEESRQATVAKKHPDCSQL